MKTHIAEMFAFKCTELSDTIIDACGAGISLRVISVATEKQTGKAIMCSALMTEKFVYNESSR